MLPTRLMITYMFNPTNEARPICSETAPFGLVVADVVVDDVVVDAAEVLDTTDEDDAGEGAPELAGGGGTDVPT